MTDFPDLKLKALVQFPANVRGGAGIDVIKENGSYTISVNYADFSPPVVTMPAGDMTAVMYNITTNTYYLAPISIFTSSVSVNPAIAVPLVESGAGAVGVSVKYAREDHAHPDKGALMPAAIGVTIQAFDAQLFSNIPQISQSANYTTIATDAQKHIFHPSADTTARTFTIAANASVAYPVGTAISFVNQNAGGVITIAITSDTMRLAGAGTTGNRTLAANGVCTALKITTTEWIISGTGLT